MCVKSVLWNRINGIWFNIMYEMQYIFKYCISFQILFNVLECEFVVKDTYVHPSLQQNIQKCQ